VLHLLHNAKFDQRFFKKSYEAHGVQDYTQGDRKGVRFSEMSSQISNATGKKKRLDILFRLPP
jgi:hypothetical protein